MTDTEISEETRTDVKAFLEDNLHDAEVGERRANGELDADPFVNNEEFFIALKRAYNYTVKNIDDAVETPVQD